MCDIVLLFDFISSPEPKALGELIVYQSSRRLCVCQSVCLSTLLKTHFGLHNTLMTLSSLEIRTFGVLRISYRYGACNGVIKLAIKKKKGKINQPSFLLFFCLQFFFNFIVFIHSCNNDEIFLGKHEFVSFSNKQLEINFTLDDRC